MNNYPKKLAFIGIMLGILLLAFTDARMLFYFFNKNHFDDYSIIKIVTAFFYGIRFDLSAIFFSQAIWIFFLAFIWDLSRFKWLRLFL